MSNVATEDMRRLVVLIEQCSEFEAMSGAEVEGLLFGIKCGPKPLTPGDWLPVVFGESPAFESSEQAQEAYGLAVSCYQAVDRAIDDGKAAVLTMPIGSVWLQGLQNGFDISAEAWKPWIGNSVELEELVAPIFALADHYGVGAAESAIAMDQALHDAAIEAIPGLLVELHNFWKATPLPENPSESERTLEP